MSALADVFRNADPINVEEELNTKTAELDTLGKDLDAAIDEYNAADEAWLILYDAVSEQMREEYQASGRKSDPAEHVILTETRRQHRVEYTRWKRAKRNLDRIDKKLSSTGKVVSARQTQTNGLRDELKAQVYTRS